MKTEYTTHPEIYGAYTISLDGEEQYKIVHYKVFGKCSPFKKQYPSIDAFNQHFQELELRFTKEYAWKRLAVKSWLKSALASDMKKVWISEDIIEQVIKGCESNGYLDDNSWIERFIRKQINKRYGPKRISFMLQTKGIPEDIAQKFVRDVYEEGEQIKGLEYMRDYKYAHVNFQDYKSRQKVIAALLQKGYYWEQVKEVFSFTSY